MHYANGIVFAGRYEVILIDTQANGEWFHCKYTESGVSIQKLDHVGWLSRTAGALSINLSFKNTRPFVTKKQKKKKIEQSK